MYHLINFFEKDQNVGAFLQNYMYLPLPSCKFNYEI